jgi:hypothetical protein
MEASESGRYQARMSKRRGDVELTLDLGEGRREAIMKCLERGDLRMVLQDVDLDRLAVGDLGGGYLWD